jgi:hypothetical protein
MVTTVAANRAGIGVSNGASNKAAFDRWFRYPAGLSQQALLQLFAPGRNEAGGAVVDPFCGAGTVGSRAAEHSLEFLGIEAHPEIAKLASIKLQAAPNGLLDAARDAVLRARSIKIDVTAEHDLVKRCFTADVLQDLAALRESIKETDPATAEYLKWALLGTLRDVANVKVGWPYLRPKITRVPPHRDAATRFLARVSWMDDDLLARGVSPEASVITGDSGLSATWATGGVKKSAGTVSLTSPPYLNNFDYADATRLEMYFWGRNSTWKEMVADVRARMLIATTQQSSLGGAEYALEAIRHLPKTRAKVISLTTDLVSEKKKRVSGKEYDRVLPQYILGISSVLEQLSLNLTPGSWCGWVVGDSAPYGVYVDTPALIQGVALELGFTNPESERLRERGLRWRSSGMRHQVKLDERVIWMRTAP